MSAPKPSRAVALPTVAWNLPDLGRGFLRVSAFVFCLTSALLLTALRLEITRSSYELSELYAHKDSLATEVSRLEIEAAALAAPRRIEALAKKLGFVYPDRGSIIVLDE